MYSDDTEKSFDDYLSGKRTSSELSFYAQNDTWPPTEKESYYGENRIGLQICTLKLLSNSRNFI